MKSLVEAAALIQGFEKGALTRRISELEASFCKQSRTGCLSLSSSGGIQSDLLDAALVMKRAAGQVNVLIHAIGILLSLPFILEEGESVEALSLGAGNTGRAFDLETNRRIAEFKFITWKGGPESIRQNSLFKDFFLLAEHETAKKRFLFVLGKEHPEKFLEGGRAITSVLSRNNKLSTEFFSKYGSTFAKVSDYYKVKKSVVELVDIKEFLPQFARQLELAEHDEEASTL